MIDVNKNISRASHKMLKIYTHEFYDSEKQNNSCIFPKANLKLPKCRFHLQYPLVHIMYTQKSKTFLKNLKAEIYNFTERSVVENVVLLISELSLKRPEEFSTNPADEFQYKRDVTVVSRYIHMFLDILQSYKNGLYSYYQLSWVLDNFIRSNQMCSGVTRLATILQAKRTFQKLLYFGFIFNSFSNILLAKQILSPADFNYFIKQHCDVENFSDLSDKITAIKISILMGIFRIEDMQYLSQNDCENAIHDNIFNLD